jgi:hypothetical protein
VQFEASGVESVAADERGPEDARSWFLEADGAAVGGLGWPWWFFIEDGEQRLRLVVFDVVDVVHGLIFIRVGLVSPCLAHLLNQAFDFADFGCVDVEVVDAVSRSSISPLGEGFWALVGGDDAEPCMVGDGGPELNRDPAPLMGVWSLWKAPVLGAFEQALHDAAELSAALAVWIVGYESSTPRHARPSRGLSR